VRENPRPYSPKLVEEDVFSEVRRQPRATVVGFSLPY
jgi:hypothetical protein